jgi:amidase
MPVTPPTLRELERIARDYHLDLPVEELERFRALMAGPLESYARLDEMAEPAREVKYPRSGGHRPDREQNPLNAWYWRCSIKGADGGRLAGKRIAIKDNICVAGIPMMNGSAVLEGYVPDADATVVSRILTEGGEIVGKSVCEHLCFSGGSHTSDTGPVENPRRPGYSAGGSSSGSAALVAAGEVDMALGGDQGGSIRMPAGWCGVVGHKPTYGLVPYTGAFPIELTLDHLGPITPTAADAALLLDVIAGTDGLDPRQPRETPAPNCVARLSEPCDGMRVGVVEEGFGWPGASEQDVDQLVRTAATSLKSLGVTVEPVSVPFHRDGIHVWNAIAIEGATALMVNGNGMGTNWKGHYTTGLLDYFGRSRVARADDLSPTVKLVVLLGQYMHDSYQGRYYAKAQNLARRLTAAYDDALSRFDALLMPTLPMKATPLPARDAPLEEIVDRALEMLTNTCPFDITGHPALSVPAGDSDGLPVGMMLVGRHWDDASVLRLAHAYEGRG